MKQIQALLIGLPLIFGISTSTESQITSGITVRVDRPDSGKVVGAGDSIVVTVRNILSSLPDLVVVRIVQVASTTDTSTMQPTINFPQTIKFIKEATLISTSPPTFRASFVIEEEDPQLLSGLAAIAQVFSGGNFTQFHNLNRTLAVPSNPALGTVGDGKTFGINNQPRSFPIPKGSEIITAFAGSLNFLGDGGPAVQARLYVPSGVAADAQGNVYIADSWNDRIRRVGPDGIITTFAGIGLMGGFGGGFSGDSGPATQANLSNPQGVAVDAKGNVYIADTGNHRICRVGPDGIITTFAGTGRPGFSGDEGPATQARLNGPSGVIGDAKGVIYIVDSDNHRIRRVGPDGIITTFAGRASGAFSGDGGLATEASLNRPSGVAVDAKGNVYIADSWNNRIRRVGPDGIITTFSGSGPTGEGGGSFSGDKGPAVQARLNVPSDVAVDAQGNVHIADLGNGRIRRVGPDGIITTFAGTGNPGFGPVEKGIPGDRGPAAQASLAYPSGVAVDAKGNVYIADTGHHRIRRVGPDGIITTFAGTEMPSFEKGIFSGDGGPATQARLFFPSGVAVDAKENLYIADRLNHRIHRVGPDGIITTVAGMGSSGFSGDGGPATQARLSRPSGVAVDAKGNLYIADQDNHSIRRVGVDGIITTLVGTGTQGFSGDGGPAAQASLAYPSGVAVDAKENLYIADSWNNRIRRVGPDGIITTFAAGGGGSEGLYGGVAVDAKGNLYITEPGRIRRAGPDGIITTFAGRERTGFSGDGGPATQARLSRQPSGVAVDAKGNLYIADSWNNRIRRVGPDGIITTFAGTGEPGLSGDGGLAAEARLLFPFGVAVDAKGNLYIADTGNDRIRRVSLLESPSISLSVSSLALDNTTVGTTSQKAFTILNTGTGSLSVTEITVRGTDACKVSPTTATIAAGDSQKVTVTFTPTSAGTKSATLFIVHNAAGSPSTVALSGTGLSAAVSRQSPDFDGDGEVSFDDFFLFASAFGQKATGNSIKYDLDSNGEVDFNDFFMFAEKFGKKP